MAVSKYAENNLDNTHRHEVAGSGGWLKFLEDCSEFRDRRALGPSPRCPFEVIGLRFQVQHEMMMDLHTPEITNLPACLVAHWPGIPGPQD